MKNQRWLIVFLVMVVIAIPIGFFHSKIPLLKEYDSHAESIHLPIESAELFPRGPHRGRLLEKDAFQVELTIFEPEGVPPRFRIYFYENMITVTQDDEDWDTLQTMVKSVIQTRMPIHNADINLDSEKKKARESLPVDIQKIEEILDRTVRPGLQSDGGNIEVIKLEGKELFIKYEGACGGCPSSTSGTLYAIEDILRNEFDKEIFITPTNPNLQ